MKEDKAARRRDNRRRRAIHWLLAALWVFILYVASLGPIGGLHHKGTISDSTYKKLVLPAKKSAEYVPWIGDAFDAYVGMFLPEEG